MALDPLLPVFAYQPDWSQGVSERLAFRTEALPARTREEQTRATLVSPKRSLEFALGLQGTERQLFNGQLWSTRKGEWYLPIWTDGLPLPAALAIDDIVLTLDTTGRDFTDGGALVFRGEAASDVEIVEIFAIVGTTVTLVDGVTHAWPAGTVVFPARRARLDESFSGAAFTGSVMLGRMRFVFTEPSDWPALAPAVTYRGFPVLTTRPHTGRDPETDSTLVTDELDDGIGPPAVFDWVGMPLQRQTHDWWLPSRAAIAEFRGLVYALQGKRNSIWVPTWLDDLTIVASLGSSATALRVAFSGYTANLFGETNRRDLRIELKSGAVHYRRVDASSVISASIEELTLSSALGVAIAVSDVLQISFLSLCRSDSDLFQLEWWTGEFAEVGTAWRGRKHDL